MKRQAMHVVVVLVAFALASTPSLAGTDGAIEADIPFEFQVADRVLPPGSYIVDLASGGGASVLMIRAKDGDMRVMFDTDQMTQKEDPKAIELVFDHVGGKVYLMEVWGLVASGREVKHTVDGKRLERAPPEARQRITVIRREAA